jgi:hypothetical protein
MRIVFKLTRPQARDNDSEIDSNELMREKCLIMFVTVLRSLGPNYDPEQGLKRLAI